MIEAIGKAAKRASIKMSKATAVQKRHLLCCIADQLRADYEEILDANAKDMASAKQGGLSEAMQDRLLLTKARLEAIAADVVHVAGLADPVGKILDGSILENGLSLQRRCVPLGVIGVIYEARPNVTVDVAALCLKTGNAAILRGGKETVHSNAALIKSIAKSLEACDLPVHAVQSITDPDRKLVLQLLKMDKYVDMIIPRGGESLQRLCKEEATIPVILGGIGVCHIYVDESANLEKSIPVIENAKTQRPSTCNTVETLLVHKAIAQEFLPRLHQRLLSLGVRLHACPETMRILAGKPDVTPVLQEEYGQEWLSLDLNVRVVCGLEEAVEHIRTFGSAHSEAILTEDFNSAESFVTEVDAAAVYVNASTRFTDGAQFGLGAEVAVSTQKLHARGPVGLEGLTTYKWIGQGQYLLRK